MNPHLDANALVIKCSENGDTPQIFRLADDVSIVGWRRKAPVVAESSYLSCLIEALTQKGTVDR